MEMYEIKNFLTCEEVEADFDKMLNDEEEMTEINLMYFTEIFGTGYHWGVPYRLDKEKYKKLFDIEGGKDIEIENPNHDMSVEMEGVSSIDLKRADSVTLDLNICLGEDECVAVLYIFSNIKDEDGDPMYDCIHMYGVEDFADLKEFILKVTDCLAGNDQVDNKFIDSMIAEKEDQINELLEDIETFRKFKK